MPSSVPRASKVRLLEQDAVAWLGNVPQGSCAEELVPDNGSVEKWLDCANSNLCRLLIHEWAHQELNELLRKGETMEVLIRGSRQLGTRLWRVSFVSGPFSCLSLLPMRWTASSLLLELLWSSWTQAHGNGAGWPWSLWIQEPRKFFFKL